MTEEKIRDRIDEINKEIELLHVKEDALQEELSKLQEELDTIEVNKNQTALLNEIFTVEPNNSMVVHLYKDTKTTPIMDEFQQSDKSFLVFDKIFSIGKNWTKVSLVVVKDRWNTYCINSGLTMTDLKKESGRVIREGYTNHNRESDRFFTLANELERASTKMTDNNSRIPFDNPIRLGGQTYANQSGYGSYYEGEFQVTQGTLYGETTGFIIIGIITHPSSL